jgi:hypothetical protein
MVTTVLLNVALICATPDTIFRRSRRLGRGVAALAII